ncbi:MAG TPA: hypothetical protein DCY64_04730 [Hydrogenophaga sp.]|uniref:S1C family serine protease n=1 Tax=Hydrogenophaga sp. TaxID=1904254 RepID=UPI000AF79A31|nr:serine protease [Hydrogenophaga sp.]HAX19572.1 hypothetical protein [Hydrogenophaga sp.]HBU19773.1 hypothetical protein [Hydrogenophaga sp.]
MRIFVLLLSVALSACSVKLKTVGSFEDYDELFVGDVVHNPIAGGSEIQVETLRSKVRCHGYGYGTGQGGGSFGCAGQRGRADLTCTDGRKVVVDYVATACSRGYGSGVDQNGAKFNVVFGLEEDAARSELAKIAIDSNAKPSLPVYKPKETRKEKGFATGTGFFVSTQGHLVTNFHVIDGSNEITIKLPSSGQFVQARLIQKDPANDIALLKIDATTRPIPIARQSLPSKGEEVLTLGYPLVAIQGQEQKATFGRINALTGIRDDVRFLQVDTPIQPGNSGGPLLDISGRVVGVVTATLDQIITLRSSGSLPQNVNYAVKSDYIMPLLKMNSIETSAGAAANPLTMKEVIEQREASVVLVIAK